MKYDKDLLYEMFSDDAILCATAYTNHVSPETVWMHSSSVTGRVETVFDV